MNNIETMIDLSVIVSSKLGEIRDDVECDINSIERWITAIILRTENEARNHDSRCEICLSKENRSDLEEHHIAGRKHDSRTIIVCKKCHRILSNIQKLRDNRWRTPNQNIQVRKGFFLQGLYDILMLKAEKSGNSIYKLLACKLIENISVFLR